MKFYIDEKIDGEDVEQVTSRVFNSTTHYIYNYDHTEVVGNLHLNVFGETGQFAHNWPISITIPNGKIKDGNKLELKINSFNEKYKDGSWIIKAEVELLGTVNSDFDSDEN